jgi:hypothetical protein
MEKAICHNEDYTKVDIPEQAFLSLIARPLSALLEKTAGLSEGVKTLFLGIYPLLRDGAQWSSVQLFQHCTEDPVLGTIVKSRTNIIRYLDILTEIGFLKKEGERKITYALGDSNLKELRLIEQVCHNPKFRNILEENYIFIHIITCVLARLVRPLFPEDMGDAVFGLASVLIQAGVKLAAKELEPRHVLDHPCPQCIYPFQPANQPANDLPLEAQVKQFISIRPEGVLKSEILDFFDILEHSESEISQVIQDLINQGETRIYAGRYILNT